MRLNFTISRKLGVGFGLLILAIILNGYLTYNTLTETIKKNGEITNIYIPSKSHLKDLKTLVEHSGSLIISWLGDHENNTSDKKELVKLHDHDYHEIAQNLDVLVKDWSTNDRNKYDSIRMSIDTLLGVQRDIMKRYHDSRSYFMPVANMIAKDKLEKSFKDGSGEYRKMIKRISRALNKQIARETELVNEYTAEMEEDFNKLQDYVIYISLILVLAGIAIGYFTSTSIIVPLTELKNKLLVLGQGKLPPKKKENTSDEIGQMSDALDNLIEGLEQTSEFAQAIGKGDFKSKFTPLSKEDALGNSLLIMRENLAEVYEEDRKRNWTTEGLAQFGEILRKHSDDVSDLASNLISELVDYLGANQGGLFVINQENERDIYLDLAGCYAWDRVKFLEEHIREGEGLVGQVWQERQTLYINDIPDDYVKIVSGLGEANPKSILIVPMIVNDEIFGVIELASFNQLEDHQIKFVERVAETTAATISTVKVNQRTKQLLEQTQKATEKMKTHDKELRENQVEMKNAQKEMKVRIEEMQEKLHESQFNQNQLKEENEILQNILLKTSKELERFKD